MNMSTYSLVREGNNYQIMVVLSIFYYIIWVGRDIIIIHVLICTVYMLTSVIKHYICLIVNRAEDIQKNLLKKNLIFY